MIVVRIPFVDDFVMITLLIFIIAFSVYRFTERVSGIFLRILQAVLSFL
jgi:hypothetical protein